MTSSSSPAAPRCRSSLSAARRRRASRKALITAFWTPPGTRKPASCRPAAKRNRSLARRLNRRLKRRRRADRTPQARRLSACKGSDVGLVRFRLATWNVNSLKVRLPHLLDWLASARPDVMCLQETKLEDANFPRAEIEGARYQAGGCRTKASTAE